MHRRSILLLASLSLTVFSQGNGKQLLAAEVSGPTIVVAQDASGDFQGHDEKPIIAAIEKAGEVGGTVLIAAGRYLVRQRIRPVSNVTIKGTAQTVLKLPSPATVKAPASKGQRSVVLDDTAEFAANTSVEILPPAGKKHFPGTETEVLVVKIVEITSDRLTLAEGLTCAVPERSRIGYANNLFEMRREQKNVRFENLTIDGGRKEGVPMPGHVQRCAILAHGAYSYEKGPSGPPLENLVVASCRIRNCYGRAVAFYSVVKSHVQDCLIEDIDDEGIDLDHFCYHCQATGNRINRSVIGICLNDASYCIVEDNRIADCSRSGIVIWWWYRCPMEGLNVENLIRNNSVHSPKQAGISVGKRCFRNRVLGNYVEGGIKVVEKDNVIEDNTVK